MSSMGHRRFDLIDPEPTLAVCPPPPPPMSPVVTKMSFCHFDLVSTSGDRRLKL